MLINKLLLIVTNLNFLKKAKEVGVNTFLFPLKNFCVGYELTFSLNEIQEENSFLYINRVLDNDDIENLKKIITELPSNIKGICFEDLGLIPILKDYELTKILFSHHLTTNYKSINYYLDYVDSVVISTDITENEIHEIKKRSNQKLSLFSFGMIPIMYSRRTLLTNYFIFYNKDVLNQIDITEKIKNKSFRLYENEYGTVIYLNKFYHNFKMVDDDILYHIVNPLYLDYSKFRDLINLLSRDYTVLDDLELPLTEGFLNTKTIFKLPPKEEEK